MKYSPLIDFFSGIAGATASVYVGQPLDTVKTKLQTFPQNYRNFLDCTRQTFVNEGFRGLYAGTFPSLLANAAENGILFMAYGVCQNLICSIRNKSNVEKLSAWENMAAGSLAASISSLALCPTELVKCRAQTLSEMHKTMLTNSVSSTGHVCKTISPMQITREILRTEGPRGLFRGLTSTWARECPGYGCFFGGYELTRSLLVRGNEQKTDIGLFKTWMAGGTAGICFWILMFPIDAVKSRIQVFKSNLSFPKYTLEIIRNEGFTTLYAGLSPTLIRTFIATGVLFITYEQVRRLLYRSL